mgnify:CR=1 FL=1
MATIMDTISTQEFVKLKVGGKPLQPFPTITVLILLGSHAVSVVNPLSQNEQPLNESLLPNDVWELCAKKEFVNVTVVELLVATKSPLPEFSRMHNSSQIMTPTHGIKGWMTEFAEIRVWITL